MLFEEAHSGAWTIRPELAREMQPQHPEDSSYALAARALADRDFEVVPHGDGPLTSERLAGVDVLVLPHQALYHSGIDRSKLGEWLSAHDLISGYVEPVPGSRWAKEARDELPEVTEPKELVDLVKDAEFPLSLFYLQLQRKLEPVLARDRAAPAAAA